MQQTEKRGLTAGLRQTQRMIASGRAVRVMIASDADERIRLSVQKQAEEAGIPVEMCESMAVLGRRCHIPVPCSAAAEFI
ncbi:MAG: ribosomal L7Ae/L30e/S12e/Gadd45 family protein [Clostridia bacterium]|nr:ribosomal L7Ae/L30e/S12e/Gadd45 family protein [Clostridia bacterium]